MYNPTEPSQVICSTVRKKLEESESIKSTAMSDIDEDGAYCRRWVFLTKRRLMVVELDGSISFEYPVKKIKSIEDREYTGSGLLLVETTDGRVLEVARFSKTRSQDFLKITRDAISVLKANGNGNGSNGKASSFLKPGNGESESDQCPKCGRTLPAGTSVCPFCVQKRKVIGRLLGYVRPYWKQAVASMVLLVIITVLSLIPPLLLGDLIDTITAIFYGEAGEGSMRILTLTPIYLVIVYFSMQGLSSVRTYTMGWLGENIIYDVRTRVYRYLQMLSLSFYDRRRTGELMSRVTNDSANIRAFLVNGIPTLLVNTLTMVGVGIILFTIDWKLAAVSLLPVPVLLVGTTLFAKKIHGIYHTIWRTWARMSSVLADTIPGVLVVKAFAQEDKEVSKFKSTNNDLRKADMNSFKLRSIFFPLIGLLMYLGSVFVYWRGGFLVAEGTLSPGKLVIFVSLLWRFYTPVQSLSTITDQIEMAATAAERIFEILDSRPEIRDSENSVKLGDIKGHIVMRNVSFSYRPEKKVLKDINLEIKPGQVVGLAGSSGSGKSTLAKMICRFYDPDEGTVEVDGVDLRKVNQRSFRERIGVVLQEPFLFHGSVAENIAYGKPHASREEIMEAARAANAHQFILRLPEGYDTEVGERGARLSGGEKQRISIARAIINKPSIIILDEATSSVDTVTEKMIQEALERLIEGRTTIAIAHRLSTLSNADKLVIMDEGRIVEEGTHESLLEKDGVYAKLVTMQTEMAKAKVV